LALICSNQTDGVGSRGNSWIGEEGNFFASIAIKRESLPEDLPLISSSIYFGWLMVELLRELKRDVWLKWPNDIYLKESKVGGVITNSLKGFLVVGIGVNLKDTKSFRGLNLEIAPREILELFLKKLKNPPAWSSIFREVEGEFDKSREFLAHIDKDLVSLKRAKLLSDGSLLIDGKRVVSIR